MNVEEQVAQLPDTQVKPIHSITLTPCVEPTTSEFLPEVPAPHEGPDTHEPTPANDMTTVAKPPKETADVHHSVASAPSAPFENAMVCLPGLLSHYCSYTYFSSYLLVAVPMP